jgi:hypothetical protein
VRVHYGGKNKGLLRDISIDDAIWMGRLLTQLSDQQITDAFRAANYTPAQINLLVRTVRARSDELINLRPAQQIGRR